MPDMSEILDRLSGHAAEQRRKLDREVAWRVLADNFIGNRPHRMLSGIAVSSTQELDGVEFAVRGVQFALPVPLLSCHDWNRPVGKIIGISIRGDQINFTAELANSGRLSAAEDIWSGLLGQRWHGVSVCGRHLPKAGRNDTAPWLLDEISIAPEGLDTLARVCRVWEKLHVVSLTKPSITERWASLVGDHLDDRSGSSDRNRGAGSRIQRQHDYAAQYVQRAADGDRCARKAEA